MGAPVSIFALSSAIAAYLLLPASSRYSPSNIWIVCLAFVVQLLLWTLYSVFIYPFYTSPFRNLPQAPGHTFRNGQLGHWFGPGGAKNFGPVRWSNTIPNDGIIRYFDEHNAERLLVTSPKGLADLLVNNSYDFVKRPSLRWNLSRYLGVGMFVTEGDVHKRQRKHLLPAFAFRHVKNLYPTFWSKSAELVKSMQDQVGEVIEVGNWCSRATLDIIGVAGMGDDFNTIQKPDNELVNVYGGIFKLSPATQFRGTITKWLPVWILAKLPSERSRQIVNGGAFVRNYCKQLVRDKKLGMEKGEYGDDIISIAVRSGEFSDEELADQMMTFLAAGHETTALSVQWAIYLLCKHQDVQERLRQEVRAQLPSPSETDKNSYKTAAESLDSVAYLHAVVNEALRLYPVIPFNVREAARDSSILGHRIPKGTILSFCPWALNLSKEQWGEDAEDFNPDRWMGPGRAKTGGAQSNYAFQTFLHGPRSCIAMGFAKAEMACLIGAMVGRFEIRLDKPDEPIKIRPGASIRPMSGVHVRMKVVDGW